MLSLREGGREEKSLFGFNPHDSSLGDNWLGVRVGIYTRKLLFFFIASLLFCHMLFYNSISYFQFMGFCFCFFF